MPDPRDEFTLLCEACGYVVEGLPAEGQCPECGRLIAASLPQAREGTEWQRHPNPGTVAWCRTAGRALRRPVRIWESVRISGDRGFGRATRWIAALLISVVVAARLVREWLLAPGEPIGLWPGLFRLAALGGGVIVGTILAMTVLSMLTHVEYLGVRFFGARRQWRVTPAVANTVCGHASVGWLVAALLWAACALAVDTGIARRLVAELGMPRPRPSVWLRALAPVSGFMLGLLIFEFLVYFGIRHNRFANRARPVAVETGPR